MLPSCQIWWRKTVTKTPGEVSAGMARHASALIRAASAQRHWLMLSQSHKSTRTFRTSAACSGLASRVDLDPGDPMRGPRDLLLTALGEQDRVGSLEDGKESEIKKDPISRVTTDYWDSQKVELLLLALESRMDKEPPGLLETSEDFRRKLRTERGSWDCLPIGHHLVFFPPRLGRHELMPDGTDINHWPGGPYIRRMWAGGQISFMEMDDDSHSITAFSEPGHLRGLLKTGRPGWCRETLLGLRHKKGRDDGDDKVYVTLNRNYGILPKLKDFHNFDITPFTHPHRGPFMSSTAKHGVSMDHVIDQPERILIKEKRELVFLKKGAVVDSRHDTRQRPVRMPFQPEQSFDFYADATLLFQLSALTYNAHAIHLDLDYARNVEGYRNLVVHGQLPLILMLQAMRWEIRRGWQAKFPWIDSPVDGVPLKGRWRVASISYRNLAPLYSGEKMRVCWSFRRGGLSAATDSPLPKGMERLDCEAWVEGPDGGLAVRATIVLEGCRNCADFEAWVANCHVGKWLKLDTALAKCWVRKRRELPEQLSAQSQAPPTGPASTTKIEDSAREMEPLSPSTWFSPVPDEPTEQKATSLSAWFSSASDEPVEPAQSADKPAEAVQATDAKSTEDSGTKKETQQLKRKRSPERENHKKQASRETTLTVVRAVDEANPGPGEEEGEMATKSLPSVTLHPGTSQWSPREAKTWAEQERRLLRTTISQHRDKVDRWTTYRTNGHGDLAVGLKYELNGWGQLVLAAQSQRSEAARKHGVDTSFIDRTWRRNIEAVTSSWRMEYVRIRSQTPQASTVGLRLGGRPPTTDRNNHKVETPSTKVTHKVRRVLTPPRRSTRTRDAPTPESTSKDAGEEKPASQSWMSSLKSLFRSPFAPLTKTDSVPESKQGPAHGGKSPIKKDSNTK